MTRNLAMVRGKPGATQRPFAFVDFRPPERRRTCKPPPPGWDARAAVERAIAAGHPVTKVAAGASAFRPGSGPDDP